LDTISAGGTGTSSMRLNRWTTEVGETPMKLATFVRMDGKQVYIIRS
jgi:hypothetical protein